MKAIYITEPGKVKIRDVPKPGEALLKVLYGGIINACMDNQSISCCLSPTGRRPRPTRP